MSPGQWRKRVTQVINMPGTEPDPSGPSWRKKTPKKPTTKQQQQQQQPSTSPGQWRKRGTQVINMPGTEPDPSGPSWRKKQTNKQQQQQKPSMGPDQWRKRATHVVCVSGAMPDLSGSSWRKTNTSGDQWKKGGHTVGRHVRDSARPRAWSTEMESVRNRRLLHIQRDSTTSVRLSASSLLAYSAGCSTTYHTSVFKWLGKKAICDLYRYYSFYCYYYYHYYCCCCCQMHF